MFFIIKKKTLQRSSSMLESDRRRRSNEYLWLERLEEIYEIFLLFISSATEQQGLECFIRSIVREKIMQRDRCLI